MNRAIHVFLCVMFLLATCFAAFSLFQANPADSTREQGFEGTSYIMILLLFGLSLVFGYQAIYLPRRRSRSGSPPPDERTDRSEE